MDHDLFSSKHDIQGPSNITNDECSQDIKQFVHTISAILQQNSSQILKNEKIKTDSVEMLIQQCDKAFETIRMSPQNYFANPKAYSDQQVLNLVQSIILSDYKKDIMELKQTNILKKEEVIQERAKYKSLQNNYDQLLSEIHSFTSPKVDTRELNNLREQLRDAEDRIRLQQTFHDEEIGSLKSQLEKLKARNLELEDELSTVHLDNVKRRKDNDGVLEFISNAFGVPRSDTPEELVKSIRSALSIPETDESIIRSIQCQLVASNNKYMEILKRFKVSFNSRDPVSDICETIENQYKRSLISDLRNDFQFDRNCDDITTVLKVICASSNSKPDPIPILVNAFNLPNSTNIDNIVENIKRSISSSQAVSTESQALKQEIKVVRRKSIRQRMLTSLPVNLPISFEVPLEEPEPIEHHNISAEDLQQITNINNEICEANDELKTFIRENQYKTDQIIKEKDQEVARVRKELKKHYKEKISKLNQIIDELTPTQDEVKKLKKKNRSLRNSEEKVRAQYSQIEGALNEEIKAREQLEYMYDEASRKLHSYASENVRLTRELTVSQTTANTRSVDSSSNKQERLGMALENISEQYFNISRELSQEVQMKSRLITVVQKLFSINDLLVKRNRELMEDICSKSSDESVDDKDTIDSIALVDILSSLKSNAGLCSDIDDIKQISISAYTVKEKLQKIFTLLLERLGALHDQCNEPKATESNHEEKNFSVISRLFDLLNSQIVYIEKIASTDDQAITVDIRRAILENAAKTHAFLSENCVGYTEDTTIYDILGMDVDPLAMQEGINNLIAKIGEIDEDVIVDVIIVIRQVLAACLIIRRFAKEAQETAQRNAAENRLIKSDMEQFRQEVESAAMEKCAEEKEEIYNEMNKKLESIRNVIRSSVTNQEVSDELLRCLSMIEEGTEFESHDNSHINCLQAEIEHYKKEYNRITGELSETKKELTMLRECASKEVNDIQNVSDSIEADATQLIKSHIDEIARLTDELNQNREHLNVVSADFENVRKSNVKLERSLCEVQQKLLETEEAHREELAKYREKAAKKFNKTLNAIAIEQNQRIERLQQRLKSTQRELKQHQGELHKKNEIIKMSEENNNHLNATKSAMEDEIRNLEIQYESEKNTLRRQNNELLQRLNAAELDMKLIQSRLKTSEEKSARDRSQFEGQLVMQKLNIESEWKTREEEILANYNERLRQLLSDISTIFRDYVDFTLPLNANNVCRVLEDVATKIKLMDRMNEQVSDYERQVRDIRQMIDAPKSTRITVAVAELLDNMKRLQERVERAENRKLKRVSGVPEEDDMNEWMKWATRVLSALSPDPVPDLPSIVRTRLEEMCFAAVGHKSLPEKLQSLRFQKKYLMRKDHDTNNIQKSFSIMSVICSLMFLRRLTRISNHLPSTNLVFSCLVDGCEDMSKRRQRGDSISSVFGISAKK